MKNATRTLLMLMLCVPFTAVAQKVVNVHGKGTYVVGENENITLT